MKGHIRRRGARSWEIKVDVGRDPVTGKRTTKYHSARGTKRDAETELTRILASLDAGTYTEPQRITVAEFLRTWIDHARTMVSAKTHERYAEIVDKHLIPTLGHHKLQKLQPIHIQAAWSDALVKGRRPRPQAPAADNAAAAEPAAARGLSALTVRHHHRVLRQALANAVRLRLRPINPADEVKPPRVPHKALKVLDPAQTMRLLAAIGHTAVYIPALLALTCGLRRGEILALRWRDVDLEGGTLSVVQSLEQTKTGVTFKAPKTARGRRTIAIPSIAIDALRKHRVAQGELRLRLGLGRDDDALVVARPDGLPVQPRTLTHEFARLVRRVDVPRVRFHDLRHSHMTHLLQAGINPKIASERAGHASVSITLDVYSHVLPGMQEDAAAKVDAALRKAAQGE